MDESSDEKKTTSPENNKESQSEEVYSLDDLDQILEAEQPGFNESLASIKKESISDTTAIESFMLEEQGEASDDEDEATETNKNENKKSILIKKISSIKIGITSYFKQKWMKLASQPKLIKEKLIYFFRHELPERIKYSRSRLKDFGIKIKKVWASFLDLSRLEKFSLIFVTSAVVISFILLSRFLGGGLLPRIYEPLMTSYTSSADFVKTISSNKSYTDFFSAFPEKEFQVLLPRVVVNFRRESRASGNTMGAFEFYLGLDSQDTAIEIKDREREILDITQRALEEFSYKEIMSVSGNLRAKARIRDKITEALNQGRVVQVYISTMVTYQ